MLVAGLPADAKLRAQLRERKTLRLRQADKLLYLFPWGRGSPGHIAPQCNLRPRITCHPGLRIIPFGLSDSYELLPLGVTLANTQNQQSTAGHLTE